jgi:SAM-dependent methyltransferase
MEYFFRSDLAAFRRLRRVIRGDRARRRSGAGRVSRGDVRGAYRFILGREPESEGVVKFHQEAHDGFEALRTSFLFSEEFRTQGFLPVVPVAAPPLEAETQTSPEILRAIIAKTAVYWEKIGKTAPHFSVLSRPCYGPDRIAETEAHFFETGKSDVELLLGLLRRVGLFPAHFRTCLEFGCGIGRVTPHLATIFPKVIALDISRVHLDLAQARVTRLGHTNVSFRQVTAEDLNPGVDYDLWFSRLVLQHNPPPVTLEILDRMFAGLPPRGVAVIHVPTYITGYRFNIAEYLDSFGDEVEMHAVPQKALLELAWRHDCCLLDMREEPAPESEKVTNIFVFQKCDRVPGGLEEIPKPRLAKRA